MGGEREYKAMGTLGGRQIPFSDWVALCAFGPYVEGELIRELTQAPLTSLLMVK